MSGEPSSSGKSSGTMWSLRSMRPFPISTHSRSVLRICRTSRHRRCRIYSMIRSSIQALYTPISHRQNPWRHAHPQIPGVGAVQSASSPVLHSHPPLLANLLQPISSSTPTQLPPPAQHPGSGVGGVQYGSSPSTPVLHSQPARDSNFKHFDWSSVSHFELAP